MIYDPMGPMRVTRVGKLAVKGNDSFATVIVQGLVPLALEYFDNEDSLGNEPKTDCKDESAFVRAVRWAQANQHDPRARTLEDMLKGRYLNEQV